MALRVPRVNRRDDPYGLAFGPARPSRGPELHDDSFDPGGFLKKHLLGADSRWTRDPNLPPVNPGPQSLFDELKAFDPRTAGGLGNLATMFVPGPGKGGRVPAWQLKSTPADLQATLGKAGVQPSHWEIPPGEPYYPHGSAVDPNSAARVHERAVDPANPTLSPYALKAIGPRVVGGIYKNGYSGEVYKVLGIGKTDAHGFGIVVETVPQPGQPNFGRRAHSTRWDPKRDKVLQQPPGAVTPALAYLFHLLKSSYNPELPGHKPGG